MITVIDSCEQIETAGFNEEHCPELISLPRITVLIAGVGQVTLRTHSVRRRTGQRTE